MNKLDILLMTTGLTGRLYSSLEAARRLEVAGHQVTFACPWDRREIVKRHGFAYLQLPESALYFGDFESQEAAIQAMGVDQLAEIIRDQSPDFLLIDCELQAHIIASRVNNLPSAILSSWLNIYRSPGIPPLSTQIIPSKGFSGSKAGINLSWSIQNLKKRWFHFKQYVRDGKQARRKLLQRLAQNHQLKLEDHIVRKNFIILPYYWPGLPSISMNAREFDFKGVLPQSFSYVGPMVYPGRKEVEMEHPGFPAFTRIIEEAKSKQKKIIYCSLSTMTETAGGLLKKLEEVMHQRKDWILLISIAKKEMDDQLTPPNIHLFNWIPQLSCLEIADASINQGGINTINECIHYQVPMMISSGGRFEQNGCAARVQYHGLGTVVDFAKCRADHIIDQLQDLLVNSTYRARLREIHKSAETYCTDNVVSRCIETIYLQYRN